MAFPSWARRMQSEVEQLPDTLQALREASLHIRQVSEDLTGVATTLRQVTEALDAAGLSEATTMVQRSAEAMRSSTEGMEAAQRALADMNHEFIERLTKLPGGEFFQAFRRPR